jgi:hypothetical protein
MPSDLLAEMTGRIMVLVTVLTLAAVVKALASVLRTWIEQASRTRRLTRAIEGAKPHQRSGIIMACGQLEGTSSGRVDDDETRVLPAVNGHREPEVLVLQHKRGREGGGG